MDSDLKFGRHIDIKVNKANKILGIIQRSFTSIDADTLIILLDQTLDHTHLEYYHSLAFPIYGAASGGCPEENNQTNA